MKRFLTILICAMMCISVCHAEDYPKVQYSKDWSADESLLLAKIAMSEAGCYSTEMKVLVIQTVLNRVMSDKFPDTIEDVLYQKNQFLPKGHKRWNLVPNEDCWKALEIVANAEYDTSGGVLFFESCKNEDNWHSRNLEFVTKVETMRFYK